MRGQLSVLLPTGTQVDLHWHLLSNQRLRAQFSISMEGLFARRREVQLGDQRVATLSPADTLVHLAVHACLSGGNRLVWIKDVEQCVLKQSPEWSEVVERAHEWSAGLVVAIQLARTMRVLPLDVPREVLDDLARGRLWSSLVAGLDRLAPVQRATGRRSPTRLVARSTRGDAVSSVSELRRRATSWLRSGAPTGPAFTGQESPPRPSLDPTSSPKEGGYGAREAFLKAVAQERSASGIRSYKSF